MEGPLREVESVRRLDGLRPPEPPPGETTVPGSGKGMAFCRGWGNSKHPVPHEGRHVSNDMKREVPQ